MTSEKEALIGRLRERTAEDHRRGCEGRNYACTCGFDGETDKLLIEAATTIESLLSLYQEQGEENERLREALKPFAAVGLERASTSCRAVWRFEAATVTDDDFRRAAALANEGRRHSPGCSGHDRRR